MSLFGKIFGSDAALGKVIDTAKELADDAFYTEAEKAEDASKRLTEARGMITSWMESTQGQRVARRLIAVSITATWLFMMLLTTALDVGSIWTDPHVSEKLTMSVDRLDGRSGLMWDAVVLILGFYFAAPFMGDMAQAALHKFKNKETP